MVARALASEDGTAALVFALLAPLLLLFVGGVIDYGSLASQKRRLQSVADTAAIAGAKELSVADASNSNVSAVFEAVVASMVAANGSAGGTRTNTPAITPTTTVTDAAGAPLQVMVELTQTPVSYFNVVKFAVSAKSVATVIGKPNLCLLALDPSSMGTIYLQKNAKVIGNNCGVYSNSTHPNGIKAFQSSSLTASIICSAGGHAGNKGNFQPQPLNDCPQFADPLSGRPEPSAGPCSATNMVITSQSATVVPGTYCGGLKINGTAAVRFVPGLYVMKDGPLYVDQSASVQGVNTGFYFTGNGANFYFAQGTTVDLTAPKSGGMAGILFFGSRQQTNETYQILSDNAHNVLGTIYLPTGSLSIDANQPIADQSAYTAIVALQVLANSGPTITLNTNYTATDVPVPDGIRGVGQPVALSR